MHRMTKMLMNLVVLLVGGAVYAQEGGQSSGSGLGGGQGAQIATDHEVCTRFFNRRKI